MRHLFAFLIRIPRLLLIGVVRGYQLLISPYVPSTCRYHPTCSAYAIAAFRRYGAVKGLVLTLHRLGRCHPWGGHGYDPPRWFGEGPEEEASSVEAGGADAKRAGARAASAASAPSTDSVSPRHV